MNAWKSDFGEKLLDAHKNNQKCKTIRVFIFHERVQLSDEILSLMKKQKDNNVTPMLLIDEEAAFDDFTILDGGDVIGVTNEMKYGRRLTAWYFDEVNQRNKFLNASEIILNRLHYYRQTVRYNSVSSVESNVDRPSLPENWDEFNQIKNLFLKTIPNEMIFT